MSQMATITVTLEPEREDFLLKEVRRGAAASPEDLVRDLIRNRQDTELAREKLDAAIQKGIDDIEAGRFRPIDEAFAEVRSRLGIKA
ncbi:ribbon-helix-helix domain-containing protein [Neorhizobium sp. NPDC001467]|uniref:ribbon-helix-helix domain-containing protein n=1 Tax=Neorhizobium sp. NPDC001467 TaxID=3390595 RepID=UPI003CFEF59D